MPPRPSRRSMRLPIKAPRILRNMRFSFAHRAREDAASSSPSLSRGGGPSRSDGGGAAVEDGGLRPPPLHRLRRSPSPSKLGEDQGLPPDHRLGPHVLVEGRLVDQSERQPALLERQSLLMGVL